ncbi:hypothetical protein Pfo_022891 [Paulownia fortunei]|nr:hypothetical protein Pfo_022891 [Paulownia fortunei]
MALTILCTLQPKFSAPDSNLLLQGGAAEAQENWDPAAVAQEPHAGSGPVRKRKVPAFMEASPAMISTATMLNRGMLAVEGSYNKMEALLNQNIHPLDILLLMAASEGDKPKVEELLRAGADYTVKYAQGRTALVRAATDEINFFIVGFSFQKA